MAKQPTILVAMYEKWKCHPAWPLTYSKVKETIVNINERTLGLPLAFYLLVCQAGK